MASGKVSTEEIWNTIQQYGFDRESLEQSRPTHNEILKLYNMIKKIKEIKRDHETIRRLREHVEKIKNSNERIKN
ncbi:MAG TPA: hypothetical protein VEU72_05245 [Nitrosopumilaceae archaeon]|nr:hypothetical protein [Nitrosopumilaceae archaeon]